MTALLVVDLERVLRESAAGRSARASLESAIEAFETEREARTAQLRRSAPKLQLEAKKALAAFEVEGREKIRASQGALRASILGAAHAAIRTIAADRRAEAVVERGSVHVCAADADITEEVLRRLGE